MNLMIMQLMLGGALMFNPQTADDQSNKKPDMEVTRMIRKDVAKSSSLSTKAKNVTIVTREGTITLRGTVKTTEERAEIEALAKKSAGVNKVVNELEIAK